MGFPAHGPAEPGSACGETFGCRGENSGYEAPGG
jgi:hypothetical protein